MTAMQSPTVTMSSYSSYPNPLVMPTMGYQYDINGRMTEMTSNGNAFATASYTAAGQLYQLSYGGMTETRTYNPMMQLITQSVPGYLNMTYNYSTTGQNNGRITSSVDGVTGENTAYAYDLLNRLTSASNSLWSQSYTYDGFGNLLTKSQANGSPNPSPSTSASYNANNQQVGYNYDANGNISGANNMTFGYTVENKLNSETTSAWPYAQSLYAYDPWGKRVMKETNPDPNNYEGEYNPLWEFYFYSITGQRLVTMDCNNPNANPIPSCTVVGESLYFKEKMLVSNGVYVVTDRLGSVRANTQQGSFAYYPYGDERTNNVNGLDKFATYFRDAVGQDYADQRYYNARTGWFFTVDPTAGSTGNPASLNRYAYVQGDPINLNDPRGLDPYCGPNMQWDGEGCMNGTGSSGVTGPCGSGWMTNASLEGPCQDPCGGSGSAFGEDFAPTPPSSCAVPATPAASTQTPSCMDLLMSSLTSFLSGTKFAGDAVAFEATGASFDIDPRLIAAMAFGENGQAANNPFGLGPNGSAAFSTIGAALASLGNTLDKYIYTWNETTVSELWSGNTWKVDPKKKWITIQYPGYCVGTTSQGVAGCQATGANISQFMVSMGANPNSLGFPCPE
jgi:RHS repeat-associated protein